MTSVKAEFSELKRKAVVLMEKGSEFTNLSSSDFNDKDSRRTIMFWWPKDFTFACPVKIAKFNKALLLTIIAFSFLGCATIFTGTEDTIRFGSDPEGAKVYINGMEVCKTPCAVPVKRNLKDRSAEIKLDGYKTRVVLLDMKFNVISLINFLNPILWIVDAVTGSIQEYDRKIYEVELERDDSTSLLDLSNPIKIDINTEEKWVDVYVMRK